ncbi:DedA family protein [uncultured Aureimonas sp.]|uniref:DedA family protein n=1 Tax=uncultured Aureimonas sp. TaxID=1604662 RepID=UPI0025DFDD53|nr:DedA family protein [uncultured Aureimonas sp.]
MTSIVAAISSAVIAIISAGGLPGIMLLMALESACIPIPSEIIMPFAGYLVSQGQFSLVAVATFGAIGCNLGSAAAYLVGSRGGRTLVERWSRHSMFGVAELRLAERFFQRFGPAATLVGRLLPVVRTFIALPAGLARMNVWSFHAFTFVGSWIWCWALAYLGMTLGDRWQDDPRLKTAFHVADVVVLLALGALVVWYVVRRRRAERT